MYDSVGIDEARALVLVLHIRTDWVHEPPKEKRLTSGEKVFTPRSYSDLTESIRSPAVMTDFHTRSSTD